jgi:hypothetical protein
MLRLTTGPSRGNVRYAFLTSHRYVADAHEAGIDRRTAEAY